MDIMGPARNETIMCPSCDWTGTAGDAPFHPCEPPPSNSIEDIGREG